MKKANAGTVLSVNFLILFLTFLFANFADCQDLQTSQDRPVPVLQSEEETVIQNWKGIENIKLKGEIIDRDNVTFTISVLQRKTTIFINPQNLKGYIAHKEKIPILY